METNFVFTFMMLKVKSTRTWESKCRQQFGFARSGRRFTGMHPVFCSEGWCQGCVDAWLPHYKPQKWALADLNCQGMYWEDAEQLEKWRELTTRLRKHQNRSASGRPNQSSKDGAGMKPHPVGSDPWWLGCPWCSCLVSSVTLFHSLWLRAPAGTSHELSWVICQLSWQWGCREGYGDKVSIYNQDWQKRIPPICSLPK
jgi:hypothetical protein